LQAGQIAGADDVLQGLADGGCSERMDVAALGAEVQRQGRRARIIADADGIVQTVAPEMRPGDVVAILSNGGFGGIYEKLPARLALRAGSLARP